MNKILPFAKKKKKNPNITSNNISRSIFTNRFPKLRVSLNKINTQLNPNITDIMTKEKYLGILLTKNFIPKIDGSV